MIIAVSGLHRGDNPQPGPSVIQSIRRKFVAATIIGLSYDPLESGLYSGDCDAAYLMPYPTKGPRALLERIDDICQTHRLDVIIPCLDAEIPNYFELTNKLKLRKIKVPLPTKKAFDRRSKVNLKKLGKTAHVQVPRTIVVSDLEATYRACEEIGYPLYLKGRLYGAVRITFPAEIAPVFHSLMSIWGGPVIVQSVVDGDEYDVMGIGDGKGKLLGSCAIRKMMLTGSGKAFAGIVVSNPDLQEKTERIIKALKWWGPFELEFVGEELIEINPRFPSWVDFPSQIDCNLPVMLIQMLLSKPLIPIAACQPGSVFVRHCYDIAGDITQIAELSNGCISLQR